MTEMRRALGGRRIVVHRVPGGRCIVLKESLAAVGVAGLLVLGGAATASAEELSYPAAVTVLVNPSPADIGAASPTTIPVAGTDATTDSAEMSTDTSIAAIWLGIGAFGMGGIAVAAALARRQAKRR